MGREIACRRERAAGLPLLAAFALSMIIVMLAAGEAVSGPGDGSVLGATKVADNGPDSLRFNIVVMAEGFTSSQQNQFNAYVQEFIDYLFSRAQIAPYISAINVWRVNVASNQSGADDPSECGGTGIYVNTYFDATYCSGGIQRALVANNGLCISVLNTWVPSWDQGIVLVNATQWGGTGGQISVFSVASGWTGVSIHELGHSAFGLADEYEYYAGCGLDTDANHHPGYEPSEPNVTIQTNRSLVKWRDLILPSTPLPTTINADCSQCDPQANPLPPSTIGLYEGAHYYHCNVYRPRFSCMMRDLAPDFCAVCEREIGTTLGPYMATHVNLVLQSANPSSGVGITVSPPDTNHLSDGSTPFTRVFPRPTAVKVRAPATAGGNSFSKWQLDGSDYSRSAEITVSTDRNRTATAVFLMCTETVGELFTDQADPICVNKSYCIFWRHLPGASSYEIRENGGAWVNTLGDSSKCYSHGMEGTYSYEVRALSACGAGSVSAPLTMTVQSMSAPPALDPPTLIPAGPVCLSSMYAVRWNPVAGAAGYEIRENGGGWKSTGTATIWSFIHAAAGSYTTEVRAVNICGESPVTAPITMVVAPCGDLIVYSHRPESGVPITMTPADQNAQGNGVTPFARLYCLGSPVTLEAPATTGGLNFSKWLRDGIEYSTSRTITINFDSSRTMTAEYFAPELSVVAVNSPRDVAITVSPIDMDGLADGITPFVRAFSPGTSVTLTAPTSSFGNPFLTWRRNGTDYPGGASVTLAVDSFWTMAAVYQAVAKVEVESKLATPGPGLVPVHVKLTNDVPLRSFSLPLEIRAVTPGAVLTKFRLGYAERLTSYLTGTNTALRYANPDGSCKSGVNSGYRTMSSFITPNTDIAVAALPEGMSLIRGRTSDPALPPGMDTSGSIVLSLGITGSGTFEVDTTCINPSNHILLTQENPPAYTGIVPVFIKGTITVGCVCPRQGDGNDDSVIDVFDVIKVIGVAFSGAPDLQDPLCPKSRSDVNGDGVTDVFDAIYLIATTFGGGPDPVNPCAP